MVQDEVIYFMKVSWIVESCVGRRSASPRAVRGCDEGIHRGHVGLPHQHGAQRQSVRGAPQLVTVS